MLIFFIVKELAYNIKCKKPFAVKICETRLENPREYNKRFLVECTKIRHILKLKKRKSETARW